MFTFKIPSQNIAKVVERLEKLNKKALKFNMPSIVYSVSNKYEESQMILCVKYTAVYHDIEIEGQTPIIAGYKLIAHIERLENSQDSIVSSFNNIENIPPIYRTRKPFCDHCHTHKVKKYSYLIQNLETLEYMTVGKTCLKDFFNDEIEQQLSVFTHLRKIMNELIEEDSEDKRGMYLTPEYPVLSVLAMAYASIKSSGFVRSDEPGSTKEDLHLAYTTGKTEHNIITCENDYLMVDNVIVWLGQQKESDFILNCRAICNSEYCTGKRFGLLAGLVACYLRDIETQQKIKAQFNSGYTGTLNKRVKMELTLISVQVWEGIYGYTYFHTFKDSAGFCVVWKGSKRLCDGDYNDIEEGKTVFVKATYKDHKRWNDTYQTFISRTAIVA